ncbi:MAG: DUF2069 domain-containing protein [Dokdonella sp.]|uniref:DUF2069 domain-containing protein n=1 Tax=Dokdonella sp. TaxID=2291710 RepID=UPI0025C718B4|nr:DUF2069 domain-containing protein [Dokdonella sp.]MBZ0223204.1 DUF2069 domain-containing protein [Dokdonella sp.]
MIGERIALAAWTALVALQPIWYLWLAPPANGRALLALGLVLPPLLLPLLALRRGTGRALLWIGIIALFYFCHGVVAAWVVPAARIPALVEATLCMILILALGARTRALKQAQARRVPPPPDAA